MNFEFDTEEFDRDVKIKVVGVGGGGGNAIEHMVKKGVDGVEFIVINTDVAALRSKDGETMERIQIGRKTTKGRGAGGKPPVAAESANENKEDIIETLKGASMVFIAAGMGGGTGTGAAPVIAEIAKSMNVLTVGVVTKPFDFECAHKMNLALKGIAELRQYVDALIIIPNQRLLKISESNISMKAAYSMVDDVLFKAVKSISDLINRDGVINIDFEDVKATLECSGDAHMAIGHGSGFEKAEEAVQQIIDSPLLETSIKNAGKLLINIVMSEDTALEDVAKVMDKLTSVATHEVEVIHGVDFSSEMKDEMEVTVIATSFTDEDEDTSEPAIEGGFETLSSISNDAPSNEINDILKTNKGYDEDIDSFDELKSIFEQRKG